MNGCFPAFPNTNILLTKHGRVFQDFTHGKHLVPITAKVSLARFIIGGNFGVFRAGVFLFKFGLVKD